MNQVQGIIEQLKAENVWEWIDRTNSMQIFLKNRDCDYENNVFVNAAMNMYIIHSFCLTNYKNSFIIKL